MAKQFEVLREMGFNEPMEIERFSTRTEGNMDILKIYLRRQHGDWFSKSKKFKFKRADKSLERGTAYGGATEPSGFFLRALGELEQLVKVDHDSQSKKQVLLEELEHLEKVMTRKMEDLRRQIEDL
ncbi:DUF3461 family protein [Neptuniibacter halophilus]|uniref:DUF3461 family protein n=1 Tax=Neptuniibacter halophilus TaxID=651666 RepID=UPI002574711F|nr:DUF3461 family protein [Neptuniibacter halophilus]